MAEARFSSNFIDDDDEDVSGSVSVTVGNELFPPGNTFQHPAQDPPRKSTNPFSAVEPEETHQSVSQRSVSLLETGVISVSGD